ncbi:MAG: hypothetical protein Q8M02_01605 [Candidatus Didemnitutus sp.]|nr:hypothetical protein [Candidatus Didemnitutus sp.]
MTRAVLAIALGFAGAACGEEPTAPLSESKVLLQDLKKKQSAAERAAPDATLAPAVPQLTIGQAGDVVVPPQRPKHSTTKDGTGPSQNWLLDGFDALERKPQDSRRGARRETRNEPELPELSPDDPNYFVKLYERQRDARLVQQQEAEAAQPATSATPDAFAPLLQSWLAGSPVREALSEFVPIELRGRSAAKTGESRFTVETSSTRETSTAKEISLGTGERGTEPRQEKRNPYVDALNLSLTPSTSSTESRSTAFGELPASPSSAPVFNLPARPATESPRRPPSPIQEDKKYFPQLKKF